MTMKNWFGYQSVKGCDMAWGARAIFKPQNSYPLDLLPDRQGHQYDEAQKLEFEAFCDFLNASVLPTLQQLTAYYDPSDSSVLVWHFDWPEDDDKVVVAQGSPNGSFGYFYLSVSLVSRNLAPEVVRPKGYMTEEERQAALQRIEQQNNQRVAQSRTFNQQRRQQIKTRQQEIDELFKDSEYRGPGRTVEVGNQISVHANQGQRDALVKKVIGDEALVEYFMPDGKGYLRIVHATTHADIRSVSKKSLPKKWQ